MSYLTKEDWKKEPKLTLEEKANIEKSIQETQSLSKEELIKLLTEPDNKE